MGFVVVVVLLLLQVWLVLAWLVVVLRVLVRGRWQLGDGGAAARWRRESRRLAAHLAAKPAKVPVCDGKKRKGVEIHGLASREFPVRTDLAGSIVKSTSRYITMMPEFGHVTRPHPLNVRADEARTRP
jgi:hypothetical protein